MYCSNCGRKLEDQARFCSDCGMPRPLVQPIAAGITHERPRLSRIRDGKIAGVCGGVARHLDVDVTLVRILWLFSAIFPPIPGIIAYIVCWIVMPKDPPPAPVSSNTTNITAAVAHHP